jgi:hypothetical protein
MTSIGQKQSLPRRGHPRLGIQTMSVTALRVVADLADTHLARTWRFERGYQNGSYFFERTSLAFR